MKKKTETLNLFADGVDGVEIIDQHLLQCKSTQLRAASAFIDWKTIAESGINWSGNCTSAPMAREGEINLFSDECDWSKRKGN